MIRSLGINRYCPECRASRKFVLVRLPGRRRRLQCTACSHRIDFKDLDDKSQAASET